MDKVLQWLSGGEAIDVGNIIMSLKMLAAYIFVCCYLPSFFLYRYIKNRRFIYRVVLYQIVSNLYINLFGFILAYLNFFNSYSVWAFAFVFPLIVAILFNKSEVKSIATNSKDFAVDMLVRTYGYKLITRKIIHKIRDYFVGFYIKYMKSRMIECVLLFLTLATAFVFFGRIKFFLEGYRFAAADEEVHLYWITSLLQGNSFPRGLYPHGMHFTVSAISEMFGFNVIEAYLAFSSTIVVMIMFNLYIILKAMFSSKYAIIFGLVSFCIVDVLNMYAYNRLQYSLPMEFGFTSIFFCIFMLVNYINKPDKLTWWLFVMSIAVSAFAHFYVTIVLVLLCVPVGIIYIVKIIKKKILLKLILGGLLSLVIIVTPFIAGLAIGHPFEQSMAWALGVMEVDDTLGGVADSNEASVEIESEGNTSEKATINLASITRKFTLYAFSSSLVALVLIIIALTMFVIGLIGWIVSKGENKRHGAYLLFSSFWIVMAIVYLSGHLGLPVIMGESRSNSFLAILSIPLFFFPFMLIEDIISIFAKSDKKTVQNAVTLVTSLSLVVVIIYTGYVRTVYYYASTISETDAIIAEYLHAEAEPQTFTHITTTNNITLVHGHGYHYEIIDLIEEIYLGGEYLFIPTKDIYVTVEKKVSNFDSAEFIGVDYPKAELEYVSPEYALDTEFFDKNYSAINRNSVYYDFRENLMSMLYYWMEEVKEVYADEVSIVLENDEVTVYKIEQDPYFLLNLSLDYMNEIEEDLSEN